MRFFPVILLYLLFKNVKCEESTDKSKILLPSYRTQIEEIEQPEIEKDNTRSDIVMVLVKNIKKIFSDLIEHAELPDSNAIESTGLDIRSTVKWSNEDNFSVQSTVKSSNEDNFSIIPTITNDLTKFENVSLPASDVKRGGQKTPTKNNDGNKGKHELLHLTKDLMYHEKPCDKEDDVRFAAGGNSGLNKTRIESDVTESRRSCIFCDNVQTEDCYDPKNKLIPSIVCESDEDLCYSQHTPFGIIDRGCFNVNHNLTTYVCSCNLCNYISISEMPYIFSNKRDWVDNVVELSRTRHFRKSVFKGMTCLRCEVNVTTKRGDMLDSANCLEGNVGTLPVQECKEDEICAVKAIKTTGYIWRGCVKFPLYNYWWALCDTDLCNYDALISIYDYM